MKDCQKNTPISETQLILEQFEQDASYIKTGCIYFALIGIFHWLHPEEELSPDLLRKVLPKSGDRFTMPAKQLTPWLLKLKEQGLCISLERIHLFSENTPP